MGYKLKTKKSAAKRFPKSTGRGKIVRCIKGHGHFLSKMGQKARSLAGTTLVSDDDYAKMDRLLPYFGAKKKRTKALRREAAALVAAKEAATAKKTTTKKEA